MRPFSLLSQLCLPLLAIGCLTSCAPVKKVEYAQPLAHPADAAPAPVLFRTLKTKIPLGAEIGLERTGCIFPFNTKIGRHRLKNVVDQDTVKGFFHDALELQGYDVVSAIDIAVDEEWEDEINRTEYTVTASITHAEIDMCNGGRWIVNFKSLIWPLDILKFPFSQMGGGRGRMYLQIEWGVYDSLRRTTVYKTTTEGYVRRKMPNVEAIGLMVGEAFEMAAHNLGTDTAFHDLLFYGTKPDGAWRNDNTKPHRPKRYDGQEGVTVKARPLSNTPLTAHIDRTRKAAVVVQKLGHGSGFFITERGHILTNAHVVGNADRVRIVTADKSEALIAEVLRVDRARDVALLKLEDIPAGLEIITLPIRTDWPQISETIYALGAPSHTRLENTLTKGIVSAHRRNFKLYGLSQDYIQGDVQTIGGNSGGPLLDAHGNVVGLTVASLYQRIGESDSGLNVFIPIDDALAKLGINLTQ